MAGKETEGGGRRADHGEKEQRSVLTHTLFTVLLGSAKLYELVIGVF